MFRRFTPVITVLFSVLLDTAVIPMLYHGPWLIPLSLIVIMAIGMLIGRTRGMLYGMIAGLLLDISAGSLGIKLFGYIIIGFLTGFLLDQQALEASGRESAGKNSELLLRIVCTFIFAALYEIALLVYQYFSNAIFEWVFVRNLFIRALITTFLFAALFPLHRRIFVGKGSPNLNRIRREVKRF